MSSGNSFNRGSGKINNPDTKLQSDGVAIKEGYVSITPLQPQLTNFDYMDELTDWKIG